MASQSKSPVQLADWMRKKGPDYPLALSCRARLARNVAGLPFPHSSDEEDLERSRGVVLEALVRQVARDRDWDVKLAEELTKEQLGVMAEEHLTSQSFVDNVAGRAVAMRWEEGRSVMVNEEDHIRVQAVPPGNQLVKVWKKADRIDNQLEKGVQYCFDDKLGYLTSCPTNVGTGLRLSCMLHLPALVITGDIAKTIQALGRTGIYVRGLYGEGSGVAGNLLQVSNRLTLGRTEREIASHLDMIVRQVMDNEKTARKMLAKDEPLELHDRVSRALGVIERARLIRFHEALELLSLVKLGTDLELLPVRDFNMLEVVSGICSFHVRCVLESDADDNEVDKERAVQLRNLLAL